MSKRPVCIEMLGIGIPNRGAELLALSVMRGFSEIYQECTFSTSHKVAEKELARLGIHRVISPQGGVKKKLKYFLWSLLPRTRRMRSGVVLESDVDVVVDASGFAYGDFWGAKKAKSRLHNRLPKWQARKTPLVMMPQSYGPFTDPAFEQVLKPALSYASYVGVRDSVSKANLDVLSAGSALKPDISFSLPVGKTEAASAYALFIPNTKVLDSNTVSREVYQEMADAFVRAAEQANLVPKFLNHEGAKDLALCEEFSGGRAEVLDPRDAKKIKALIAGADFVFSSRYHGVVSSLAAATPVSVFGWSHKYQELMADFEQSAWICESPEMAIEKMSLMGNVDALAAFRNEVSAKLPGVQNELAQMWAAIKASLAELSKASD